MDYQAGDDRLAFVGVDGMDDLSFTQLVTGTLVSYDNYSGTILLVGANAQDLLQNGSIIFTETLEPIFGY